MKNMLNVLITTVAAFVMLFGAAAQAPAASAEPPPTPIQVKGFEIISPEQARELLDKGKFFDMRSAVNYGKGHLKGATPFPYDGKSKNAENFDATQDKFDLSKLPSDKSALIVFYSDGPTGWKSYKAAVLATRAGYTNVKWMRAGTSGWAKLYPLSR